jgi:hypothetical protein
MGPDLAAKKKRHADESDMPLSDIDSRMENAYLATEIECNLVLEY